MGRLAEFGRRARGGTSPWLMLATVAVSLLVRETYPFSHFPMYSRFAPATWYVHTSDSAGNPLPTRDVFRLSTPRLKKILRAKIDEFAERAGAADGPLDRAALEEAAGHELLRMLAARAANPVPGLQLWRVDVRRVDGAIVRRSRRVAVLE